MEESLELAILNTAYISHEETEKAVREVICIDRELYELWRAKQDPIPPLREFDMQNFETRRRLVKHFKSKGSI